MPSMAVRTAYSVPLGEDARGRMVPNPTMAFEREAINDVVFPV